MGPLVGFVWFVLAWTALVAGFVGLAVTFGYASVLIGAYVALVVPYWAVVIRGAAARKERAVEKLDSTLMASEQKVAEAIEFRICALMSRRRLIAATSNRTILTERPLLGGFTMKDFQWKDVHDARLSENVLPNVFGSRLSVDIRREGQAETEDHLLIDGIERRAASRIYAMAQEEEQAWEEKRRVRTMEESRAASGGITLSSQPTGLSDGNGRGFALEEIERAKKLLDAGAISDAEFNEIKAKILSRQAF